MSINVCNNNSMSAITSLPSGVGGGSLSLLSTQTASSSSTISFASGIDSTYKEYIVKFFDVHPATDNNTSTNYFLVNFRDGSTDYDATKTTTIFRAYHFEDNSTQALSYETDHDLAQSTSFQRIAQGMGNDNDQCLSGTLHLFDPSSTTFVKHFKSRISNAENQSAIDTFVAGYGNTTSAIDAVQFKFLAGNIDSGTIKLYGVS